MRYWFFGLLLLLGGCGPNSAEDFQHSAEEICREIALELKEVERYEQLVSKEAILEKKFHKLVDVMIAAQKFSEKRKKSLLASPGVYSQELQAQMIRLSQIEGAIDLIQHAQKESLIRLETSRQNS